MRTEVLTGKLMRHGREILECEKQIRRRNGDIQEVAAVLKQFDDDVLSEVSAKLLGQCDAIRRTATAVRTMGNTLIRILSLYEDCEEDVIDLLENGQNRFHARKKTSFNSLSDYGDLLGNMNLHFRL